MIWERTKSFVGVLICPCPILLRWSYMIATILSFWWFFGRLLLAEIIFIWPNRAFQCSLFPVFVKIISSNYSTFQLPETVITLAEEKKLTKKILKESGWMDYRALICPWEFRLHKWTEWCACQGLCRKDLIKSLAHKCGLPQGSTQAESKE